VIERLLLLLPVIGILALGIVIVIASGWGGLWLYGFCVTFVVAVAVLITRGGEVVRRWGRWHSGGGNP
jgi:hypothetical protein